MKKIPKISKNLILNNPQQQQSGLNIGLYQQLARYILRGIGLGFIFQGSFHIFGFEERIIRGVTSKQLDEIKQLENNVGESLRNGLSINIDEKLVHERYRQKIIIKQKQNDKLQQDKK